MITGWENNDIGKIMIIPHDWENNGFFQTWNREHLLDPCKTTATPEMTLTQSGYTQWIPILQREHDDQAGYGIDQFYVKPTWAKIYFLNLFGSYSCIQSIITPDPRSIGDILQ